MTGDAKTVLDAWDGHVTVASNVSWLRVPFIILTGVFRKLGENPGALVAILTGGAKRSE